MTFVNPINASNFDNYMKLALDGDKFAQFYIGDYYFWTDLELALAFFFKSACNKCAIAQYALGSIFETPQDFDEEILKASAAFRAYNKCGIVHNRPFFNLSCYFFSSAAKLNHPGAQFAYAHYTKNIDEMFKYYTAAAKQGHTLALVELGNCYYKGIGVLQDEAAAVSEWLNAAKQLQCKYVCVALRRLGAYYLEKQQFNLARSYQVLAVAHGPLPSF